MHKRVVIFNKEVLGIKERPLGLMEPEEMALSLVQFREEVKEIEDAYNEGNLVGVVDGIIDLHFFLLGVVFKHGIPEQLYKSLFHSVADANMEKKRGVKAGREGFGNAADAIKPEGWRPPEDRIRFLIEEYLELGHGQ